MEGSCASRLVLHLELPDAARASSEAVFALGAIKTVG